MRFRLPLVAEYALVFALGGVLLLLILGDARNLSNPLGVLRLILGLIYVLLLPGYFVQLALFPEKSQLDVPERITLSLVLSIALIPPVALLLDLGDRGLRTENIVIAQIAVLSIAAVIAAVRRVRVSADERFAIQFALSRPEWWEDQNPTVKRLTAVVLGALAVVAGASLLLIAAPRPSEFFTEFYLLGENGMAQGFPYLVQRGEPLMVTAGVDNREGVPMRYHIEVWHDDELLDQLEPFDVAANEQFEGGLSFSLPDIGRNQEVLFLLFREGQDTPYRTLRLWLNVR